MTSLHIDGQQRELIDIRDFRAAHNLPKTFGVPHFEPKQYDGLGSIDHAGSALNSVREAVLKSIPSALTVPDLLPFFNDLAGTFRRELQAVNDHVGLREEEIMFAVNGFDAVNHKVLFALVRDAKNPPKFSELYQSWLDESVRVSQQVHEYVHQGAAWQVNVLNNAYGRVGLRVETGDGLYYVRDEALSCPAAGFMYGLLHGVYERVAEFKVI